MRFPTAFSQLIVSASPVAVDILSNFASFSSAAAAAGECVYDDETCNGDFGSETSDCLKFNESIMRGTGLAAELSVFSSAEVSLPRKLNNKLKLNDGDRMSIMSTASGKYEGLSSEDFHGDDGAYTAVDEFPATSSRSSIHSADSGGEAIYTDIPADMAGDPSQPSQSRTSSAVSSHLVPSTSEQRSPKERYESLYKGHRVVGERTFESAYPQVQELKLHATPFLNELATFTDYIRDRTKKFEFKFEVVFVRQLNSYVLRSSDTKAAVLLGFKKDENFFLGFLSDELIEQTIKNTVTTKKKVFGRNVTVAGASSITIANAFDPGVNYTIKNFQFLLDPKNHSSKYIHVIFGNVGSNWVHLAVKKSTLLGGDVDVPFKWLYNLDVSSDKPKPEHKSRTESANTKKLLKAHKSVDPGSQLSSVRMRSSPNIKLSPVVDKRRSVCVDHVMSHTAEMGRRGTSSPDGSRRDSRLSTSGHGGTLQQMSSRGVSHNQSMPQQIVSNPLASCTTLPRDPSDIVRSDTHHRGSQSHLNYTESPQAIYQALQHVVVYTGPGQYMNIPYVAGKYMRLPIGPNEFLNIPLAPGPFTVVQNTDSVYSHAQGIGTQHHPVYQGVYSQPRRDQSRQSHLSLNNMSLYSGHGSAGMSPMSIPFMPTQSTHGQGISNQPLQRQPSLIQYQSSQGINQGSDSRFVDPYTHKNIGRQASNPIGSRPSRSQSFNRISNN